MAEAFDVSSQVLDLIKAVEGSKTALQYHAQRLEKLEAVDLRLDTTGLAHRLSVVESALAWLKWLSGALILAFCLWAAGQAYDLWKKSQSPVPILRRSSPAYDDSRVPAAGASPSTASRSAQ